MKKQAYNPYLPLDVYIPDGEPHVFNGRIYVFGSHDREGGESFCMEPYEVWSAPVEDLGNWSCPGIAYRAEQDPLYDAEKRNALYAPDAVLGNDKRYYLYYCLSGWRGKGGYSNPISAAVSDQPDGPYEYLGVVRNPDGTPFLQYANFDPAVINDEGTIRLYSGTWYPLAEKSEEERTELQADQWESERFGKSIDHIRKLQEEGDAVYGPHHMTLADDMLTITSKPVRILPLKRFHTPFETDQNGKGHGFFEGSSIRRINGKYYFVYSSRNNHELCYAVSDAPDKDFQYGGTIVSNGDIGINGRTAEERLNLTGTTHGGIEEINGQWYVFYHRLTHKSDYSRQGCAERITIEKDGSIRQCEMTSCGLNNGPLKGKGAYPSAIACVLSNGHMPHSSNRRVSGRIPNITDQKNERFVSDISDGTLIGWRYFAFEALSSITLILRGKGSGTFEILNEMDGEALGGICAESSECWVSVTGRISPFTGVSPLYLRFHGKGYFDLLTISFSSEE